MVALPRRGGRGGHHQGVQAGAGGPRHPQALPHGRLRGQLRVHAPESGLGADQEVRRYIYLQDGRSGSINVSRNSSVWIDWIGFYPRLFSSQYGLTERGPLKLSFILDGGPKVWSRYTRYFFLYISIINTSSSRCVPVWSTLSCTTRPRPAGPSCPGSSGRSGAATWGGRYLVRSIAQQPRWVTRVQGGERGGHAADGVR